MRQTLLGLLRDENGAVTVDWVVLTAAVVALGIFAAAVITSGATNLSDSIWAFMDTLDLFPD